MSIPAALLASLCEAIGPAHVDTDPGRLAAAATDFTGRHRGRAGALVKPRSPEEVSAILAITAAAQWPVTILGGGTSLVAGTVPEHHDVLLSTARLTGIETITGPPHRIRVEAGVTLGAVSAKAAAAGLRVGVDLASRDSATIGGMAATNAGGLRTVRYGPMTRQITGMLTVLPGGGIVDRRSRVLADNTGLDLTSLWVGSEGILGVICAVELQLYPEPEELTTVLLGFDTLPELLAAAGRAAAGAGISALELIDGQGVDLAVRHLRLRPPGRRRWQLLAEWDRRVDESVIAALAPAPETWLATTPADRRRLWAVRECFAAVPGIFGPPVKVDLALPVPEIPAFAEAAQTLITTRCPGARPILFGHIAEGNLHLNILACEDPSPFYSELLDLIATCGGNISSEHGVGTIKRQWLHLSRGEADIAAMTALKAALDPRRLLNPEVMLPR